MTGVDLDLTASDGFSGAGGSSQGLEAGGFRVVFAANHWDRAIETHAANFPETEHLCADINVMDKRRFPYVLLAWWSPICTELSPGGGTKRNKPRGAHGQLSPLEEYGHVPAAGFERTRATFWDVIQATEVNRYPIVVVENVVEAYAWELRPVWEAAMRALGYDLQIISVSAAHVGGEGNDPAPQWRDRVYWFCVRNDLKAPRISPSPRAWCAHCGQDVDAVQVWRNPRKPQVGKYRSQYDYRCPRVECRASIVEPYVLPAAAAIDWTDLGERIGDKPVKEFYNKKREFLGTGPLAPATMRRIRTGLDLIARPQILSVNHGGDNGRHYPIEDRPFSTRSIKIGDAMLVPAGGTWNDTATTTAVPMRARTTRDIEAVAIPGALVDTMRNHATPKPADGEPFQTFAAAGHHHSLVIPPGAFIQKHHGSVDYQGVAHMVKDVREPLPAVVAKPNLSLVIPYRRGSKPYPATEDALSTVATREQHGTVFPPATDADVEDCNFRMIKWRESANAQRFRPTYVFTGNGSENTMMAGNAVASNVPQWLAGIARDVLEGVA